MKKIFLTGFLLLIFATHGIAQSEWMKTVIDNIPVTAPPSSDITKQRRAAYNVPGEDRGFPDYTYKDFQRNQRIILLCFPTDRPRPRPFTEFTLGNGMITVLIVIDLSSPHQIIEIMPFTH